MKRMVIVLEMLLLIFLSGCEKESQAELNGPEDGIRIKSVSPSTDLDDGIEYNFTVSVDYYLTSTDSGELMIGFNTHKIDSYSLILEASRLVVNGNGTHTFYVSSVAKDWKTEGDFKVYVNLSEHPHPSPWTPLAKDFEALKFNN